MTNTDYQSVCRANAERFLKTAFILDDPPKDSPPNDHVASEIKKPAKTDKTSIDQIDTTPTTVPKTGLDEKTLVEIFIKKGICCSVIQPGKPDDISRLKADIGDAIQNVDIPILDWNLFDDNGDTITSILKDLIEKEDYPEGRIALILIYTREEIDDVVASLLKNIPNLKTDSQRDEILVMDGLKIVLINRLKYHEKDLPGFIIAEFSHFHQGILENGVMQAISDIREKTYHILHRFPQILDAPFIAHRAALDIPGDAGNHVFDLITSEIHSLLSQSGLPKRILHQATIQQIVQDISVSYLNSILRDNCPKDRIPIIREELLDLLENGIEPHSRFTTLLDGTYTSLPRPNKDKKRKNLISALTKLLAVDNTSELDAEFSELMTFQHKYPGFSPQLTLGTIVYKPEGRWSKTYYVCVMPVCACEHLTDPVSFPFLPLELSTRGNPSFHLTINHNSVRKEFRVNYSIENIRPFKFEPASTSGGIILASNNIFETVHGAKLEWIGLLKREFAQRIANQFGSEISQVGLNDSEWQRLSAK